MQQIYRGVVRLATPLLERLLQRRLRSGKEDLQRIGERKGIASAPRPPGTLLWIHGASVGELRSALPLIERILSEKPGVTVLVTSGTVTSARLAAERLRAPVIHQFIPLDHPTWVSRFYDHWRPDLVLWLESEFWPNLLTEAQRRAVKLILLNARVSDKSLRRWRLLPGLIRPLIRAFDLCLAPDDEQARRLETLGARNIRVVGNLKDIAEPLTVDDGALHNMRAVTEGRTVWLAASTHPGEEDIVAEAHDLLSDEFPSLLTIVIPRHPDRGGDIVRSLAGRGLSSVRRSAGESVSADTDIYVADTLGELGLFYRLVDVAFVGGSLIPHGGQNVAEAARLDCAIICGPHMHNFAAVAHRLSEAEALATVTDTRGLADEVRSLLGNATLATERAAAARRVAEADAAACDRMLDDIIDAIRPYLPSEPAR